MNTPDTEKKSPQQEWIDQAKEDIDTNLQHMNNQPIFNTPDTEWMKELTEQFKGKIQLQNKPDGVTFTRLKHFISTLLTSRDTYWKERVQEIVKKERGTWAKESIGDKALQSLEVALLDNLK